MGRISNVLLIDDDEIIHAVYRRLIRKSGTKIKLLDATDGIEALALLEQLRSEDLPLPELIFLDINMPQMGGFEFLDEYEARSFGAGRGKTVVIFSTSLLQADMDRAVAHPAVYTIANKIMPPEAFLSFLKDFCAEDRTAGPVDNAV